jgi:hypothetical protein
MLRHIGRVSARRPTDFFVVRQRSRQESVPRCRAPYGGALFPGPSGGVCANSPCGLKHAQPFFRLPNPPVGAPEGKGNAGYQRSVSTVPRGEARCIGKTRSAPAACWEQRRGVIRVAKNRGGRVAFFAGFLGDARKPVARRGRRRGFAEHAPHRRSRPGVQTGPWKNPGQGHAKHRKARKQGLKPYLSKRKRFPHLTRPNTGPGSCRVVVEFIPSTSCECHRPACLTPSSSTCNSAAGG